jgi:AcrR family transcriptional regulator
MTDLKQRLLADTVEYLATNGASDISLRQLAAALGTSHRMLIYHFGSKEGQIQPVEACASISSVNSSEGFFQL